MPNLSVLDIPRIFPPKKLLVALWIGTCVIAVYGLIASGSLNGAVVIWAIIAGIAIWQLWTIRWVRVDSEGVRMRNLFQRVRSLRWEDITDFYEEEVRLSKHPYVVLHLSNRRRGEGNQPVTKIDLTSDQVGFETLRAIVREAVPKAAMR